MEECLPGRIESSPQISVSKFFLPYSLAAFPTSNIKSMYWQRQPAGGTAFDKKARSLIFL
jgi:hypothetical protein